MLPAPRLAFASLLIAACTWIPLPARSDAVPADVVSLNRATAEQLATALPGIGPVKAAAIVAMRERIGAFRFVEELLDVPGIGPKTLESIRDRVRIDLAETDEPEAIDGDSRAVRAIVDAARRAESRLR